MEDKTWRKKAEIEILFIVVTCTTETYECACSSFFKVRSLMKFLSASFFLFHKMNRFDRFRRPYHLSFVKCNLLVEGNMYHRIQNLDFAVAYL